MAAARAPGLTTSAVIRPTAPAEIAATCADARSSTPFRSRRTSRANCRRRGSRGGRPTAFDKEMYKRRNEVERTINRLKHSRAIATRYDKRAYVFHGTVTLASIRLWIRP